MNGQSLAKKYPVFSWNQKIGENAIALNFSRSGGDWCSNSCLHKRNGTCYAMASQGMYKRLNAKLQRHEENGFEWTLKTALSAMKENPGDFAGIRFFRFSTHGTVPDRPFTTMEKHALIRIGDILRRNDVMIHFPVETRVKYNQVLACGIQPRLSFQGRIEHAKRAGEITSVSIGSMSDKPLHRVEQAKAIVEQLRKVGKDAYVCPAIEAKLERSPVDATCDRCGICSFSTINVVVYPQH